MKKGSLKINGELAWNLKIIKSAFYCPPPSIDWRHKRFFVCLQSNKKGVCFLARSIAINFPPFKFILQKNHKNLSAQVEPWDQYWKTFCSYPTDDASVGWFTQCTFGLPCRDRTILISVLTQSNTVHCWILWPQHLVWMDLIWQSWMSGHFGHKRNRVQIQPLAILSNIYLPLTLHISWAIFKKNKKMGHSLPLFLFLSFQYTVDSKQMFNI